jgi:hypothetical protein
MAPSFGWLIRATGSPADLRRIAAGLAGGNVKADVDGESLYLISPDVNEMDIQTSAEWASYELVRLISAAAYLRFGTASPVRFHSVQGQTDLFTASPKVHSNGHNVSNAPSLWRAVRAAQLRQHVRTALLACAGGGADGLFRAYEALCTDLMDYIPGVGTREWLIEQGWVDERQEQSFLDTVIHYGRHNIPPSFKPCSPNEVQELVRRLLDNWIDHVWQLTG